MELSIVLLTLVQVLFIVMMTKIILDYRRARSDREASALGMTTSELTRLVKEAVHEATEPLETRLDAHEDRLDHLLERFDPKRLDPAERAATPLPPPPSSGHAL